MKGQVRSFWGAPTGIATIGLIGIVGYFVITEHRQHVFDAVPFLLLGVCVLMHVFMHGGHRHGVHGKKEDSEPFSDDYQRGLRDGIEQARSTNTGENHDAN